MCDVSPSVRALCYTLPEKIPQSLHNGIRIDHREYSEISKQFRIIIMGAYFLFTLFLTGLSNNWATYQFKPVISNLIRLDTEC